MLLFPWKSIIRDEKNSNPANSQQTEDEFIFVNYETEFWNW